MSDNFWVDHNGLAEVNDVLTGAMSELDGLCTTVTGLINQIAGAAEGDMVLPWQQRQQYISNLHNDLQADLGDLRSRSGNIADIYLDGDGKSGQIMAG